MNNLSINPKAWTVAFEALSWIELKRVNEASALRQTASQLRVSDQAVLNEAERLVNGVMSHLNAVDYLAEYALEPETLGELTLGVRSFLRVYTYEMHYGGATILQGDVLADHARRLLKKPFKAVEDAIDIVPLLELPWGEFNGVEELAYRYYHPTWYVDYLLGVFRKKEVTGIISPVEQPSYLRVNTLKSGEEAVDRLFSMGVQLRKDTDLDDTYIILDDTASVTETPEYQEGHMIIQDKASILTGIAASPKPGDTVLDICAAPGIKTSHIAGLMQNKGRILSIDYNARRLNSWRKITTLLGVENAEEIEADASTPEGLPPVMADLVLLDPPCTGTGTLNKVPSARWRLTQSSIKKMAGLQWSLISNAADHVKHLGHMLYSTCSITPEENEQIIQKLLDERPDFKLVEHGPMIGEPGLNGLTEAQRLYPYKNLCNGYFIARLQRSN